MQAQRNTSTRNQPRPSPARPPREFEDNLVTRYGASPLGLERERELTTRLVTAVRDSWAAIVEPTGAGRAADRRRDLAVQAALGDACPALPVPTALAAADPDWDALLTLQAAVATWADSDAAPDYRAWVATCAAETARIVERMMRANLRFVNLLAARMSRSGLSMDDRLQEGALGLLKAIRRFDPERGVHFITFAQWWIRNSIQRAGENQAATIRIPCGAIQRHRVYTRAVHVLTQRLVRSPTTDEVAAEMGMPAAWLAGTVTQPVVTSMEDAMYRHEESDQSVGDFLAADVPLPDDGLTPHQVESIVHDVVARLPEREAYILRARYGFSGPADGPRTIAESLGITTSRVDTLRRRALEAIRKMPEAVLVAPSSASADDDAPATSRPHGPFRPLRPTRVTATIAAGPARPPVSGDWDAFRQAVDNVTW